MAEDKEPELNLEGLDSDDDNEEKEIDEVDASKVDIELTKEERIKVLLRQVDTQCKTFGA